MISVSGKKWTERKTNNRIIEKISIDNKFSHDLSKLILNRNYTSTELSQLELKFEFINPFIKNKDFLKAKNLIFDIVHKKEDF